jgi:hypothetical protein
MTQREPALARIRSNDFSITIVPYRCILVDRLFLRLRSRRAER